MTQRLPSVGFLLIASVVFVSMPAWAIPLTGFVEATAANGWLGDFSVQLTDGTVVSGAGQMSGVFTGFPTLPLATTGCVLGPGCTLVTDLSTSTSFTMSTVGLITNGSATLGSLATVSWDSQIVRLLPGDPSPTAAVLALTSGLGLTPSNFSFGFNSTLTAFFSSVNGGQTLSAMRLDFKDGTAPPTSGTLVEQTVTPSGGLSTPVFINDGVPVALGTPLSVPEPSALLLLTCSLAVLVLARCAASASRMCFAQRD